MALEKREKKMLKILGVVAAVAAVALVLIYKPKKTPAVEQGVVVDPVSPPAKATPAASGNSSGGSKGSGGGGSRGDSRGSSSPASSAKISRLDLSKHSSPDNCWVVLEDGVYDITNFLSAYSTQKEEASQFCGTIGFNTDFINGDSNLLATVKSKSSRVGTF